MNRFAIIALLSLIMVASAQTQDQNTEAAQKAAESWLALIDAGNYDGSWEQAAALFKGAVTKEQWRKAITSARAPLGKVLSRKLKSAQYTTELPGAPDGKYVVIQYDASLENKKSAIETITPMLDKDGQWRVSGYYIK
jgi:Protein of unknown function (DUF4019)